MTLNINNAMKYFYLLTITAGLWMVSACNEQSDSMKNDSETTAPKVKLPFEKRYKREIESMLSIPATEKYASRIYRADVNNDGKEDAIITVNRLEYAIDQAIKSKNTAKAAEIGYIGRYNFIFYYDGAADRISRPVYVPSSPGRELDIHFASVTGPGKNDVVAEYRIRNSGWLCYYTATGEAELALIFQWKHFDHAGEAVPEALNHVLEPSPEGVTQDISIYESSIDNYNPQIGDEYKYVPTITKKGALFYRFFYDERIHKFRIYNNQMLKDMGLKAVGPLLKGN